MAEFGITVIASDRPGLLRDLATIVAEKNANIIGINFETTTRTTMFFDIEGEVDPVLLQQAMAAVPSVELTALNEAVRLVFGKRVIVMGGGAQVAQVVLGAVSEADRHNIRGERISVDTIPLVGEEKLATAVRAVGRLPRAKVLVLAGSIMGGDIANAVRELRQNHGIPTISLAMIGSVCEAADLVVTDPVQAGTMAVMAIADTASFDLTRARGKRL